MRKGERDRGEGEEGRNENDKRRSAWWLRWLQAVLLMEEGGKKRPKDKNLHILLWCSLSRTYC